MNIPLEEKFGWFATGRAGTRFAQVYNEAADVMYGITSAVALRLLFYIIKAMDENNMVRLRGSEKRDFIVGCRMAGGGSSTMSTVNRAVNTLVDAGVMITPSVNGKRSGDYFVNPYLFWKDNSQVDRKLRIKEYHELINFKKNEEN